MTTINSLQDYHLCALNLRGNQISLYYKLYKLSYLHHIILSDLYLIDFINEILLMPDVDHNYITYLLSLTDQDLIDEIICYYNIDNRLPMNL